MNIEMRPLDNDSLSDAVMIWDQVVDEGIAFPQTDILNEDTGREFFASQTYTGVAWDKDSHAAVGLYILHPNNVGRCGHICNTSYAVRRDLRGQHIGEILVNDSINMAREYGFKILQFNAVVATNEPALKLYEKLGFIKLGTIPGGFLMKDGHYEDIIPHYYVL